MLSASSFTTFDPAATLNRARALHENGFFRSAKTTASLVIAHLKAHDSDVVLEFQSLVLFADCLTQLGENKRATAVYNNALQSRHYASVANSSTVNNKTSNQKVPSSSSMTNRTGTRNESTPVAIPSSASPDTLDEIYHVRYRCAKAFATSGDLESAKFTLEAIPAKFRTTQTALLLATISEELGQFSEAKHHYRSILSEFPDALYEAGKLLNISNMKDQDDIVNGCISRMKKMGLSTEWIKIYYGAHADSLEQHLAQSLEAYKMLEQHFRLCPDLLLSIATVQAKMGKMNDAIATFTRIRKQEPYIVDHMDLYADLIKSKGKSILINQLVEDLMNISERRPEPWTALARYCLMRTEPARALLMAEKALKCDPRHLEGYIAKGTSLNLLARFHEALAAWRKAYRFSKEIRVSKGLCETYISLEKWKEATDVGRVAIKIWPNDARSYALVGRVLMLTGQLAKARQSFDNAIAADPKCSETVMVLTELDQREGKYNAAISRLRKHVVINYTDTSYCKLGDLYMASGDYNTAMACFTEAQCINPDCEHATDSLARIDRLLNGIPEEEDQDEEEGEEEEEEEQEEGDEVEGDEEVGDQTMDSIASIL